LASLAHRLAFMRGKEQSAAVVQHEAERLGGLLRVVCSRLGNNNVGE
jgi:hypothetical protein